MEEEIIEPIEEKVEEKPAEEVKVEETSKEEQPKVENQQQVEKYKAGNERLFGFFIGQTLKKMNGKANPAIVNDIVGKKLKNV